LSTRQDIEEELLSRRVFGEFVRPSYEDYCLSNVHSTILSLFGEHASRPIIPKQALAAEGQPEKVVLIVADGLGYYNAKASLNDGGFFEAVASRGDLVPITSVFPSTTAAALTTLSTGLTPQEHGLPEWFVYMKEIDRVIATLPFSEVGDRRRDKLIGTLNVRALFSGARVYSALRSHGIDAVSFVERGLSKTAYSKLSLRGSEVVPYITSSDLMATLRRRIEKTKRRTLFYVYWEKVDTTGHTYGPGSEESRSEVSLLSHVLKTELVGKLSRMAASESFVMLTADHGQVPVEADSTIYLNGMRPVMKGLNLSPGGKRIPPWGSARDAYLSVKKDSLENVRAYLARKLGRTAVVLKSAEALEAGLFGINKPLPSFVDRVGNLMVLPRGRNLVWYRYARSDRFDLRGHHGGMNPREMLIPLATSRVSSLR